MTQSTLTCRSLTLASRLDMRRVLRYQAWGPMHCHAGTTFTTHKIFDSFKILKDGVRTDCAGSQGAGKAVKGPSAEQKTPSSVK